MRRITLGIIVLALLAAPAGAPAQAPYLPPVVLDGMAFPVARTDWFSVINFRNDWHAPRMRWTGSRWELIGLHEGIDIFAEPGTPVRAVLGGQVERLGWTFYSGWRVGIRGSDGRYWFYAHLRRYPGALEVGDAVVAGQQIGEVGNTGYGADPGHKDEFTWHLHLGIQEAGGAWVNPYPLVRSLYRNSVRR